MTSFLLVGDLHGNWDRLNTYQSVLDPDQCLLVGDVETPRFREDLAELTGPDHYIELGDFPAYWNGQKSLPVPTSFIGGNHEIWSLLHKHDPVQGNDPNLTDRIRYLGRYGVRPIGGFTVAFLTGIYSTKHYEEPSELRLNWCQGMDWQKSRATAYYRRDEVESLLEEAGDESIDLLLTHDWPTTTAFDRETLENDLLSYGNPVVRELNRLIEPTVHAAGHIHRGLHARIDGRDFYGLDRLGSQYGQDAVLVDDDFNVQWVNHEEEISV